MTDFVDNVADFFQSVWNSVPDTIFTLPKAVFFATLVGIIIACYEGIYKRYDKATLVIDGEEFTHAEKFKKIYLSSGILAVLLVVVTMSIIIEDGLLAGTGAIGTGFVVGITEGSATIKMCNRRIDLFLKKKAIKYGLSENEAQKVADAVEVKFEDVTPSKEQKPLTANPDVKFEDVSLKNL